MNTNTSSGSSAGSSAGSVGAAAGNPDSVTSSASADYRDVVGSGEQFSAHQSTSHLRDELHNLKADLDSLVSRASSLSESELRNARDRIYAKFGSVQSSAKEKLSSIQASAKDLASKAGQKATEAKQQLDKGVDAGVEYVKEKPLQSVAIAAGVGFVLGMLLRRGGDE